MSKRNQKVLHVLLLVTAISVLAAGCGSSGSIKAPAGPHMLYFNAKW